MATLSYPRHSLVSRIHKNKLAQELPLRMQEVRKIHDVNYGILVSSVLIALAVVALAWLVTVNSIKSHTISPTRDIAVSQGLTRPMPGTELASTEY